MDQLHDKSVEFCLHSDHWIHMGIGRFLAECHPEGLVALEIVSDHASPTLGDSGQTRYSLPQSLVDRIEVHPRGDVAEFRLRA